MEGLGVRFGHTRELVQSRVFGLHLRWLQLGVALGVQHSLAGPGCYLQTCAALRLLDSGRAVESAERDRDREREREREGES